MNNSNIKEIFEQLNQIFEFLIKMTFQVLCKAIEMVDEFNINIWYFLLKFLNDNISKESAIILRDIEYIIITIALLIYIANKIRIRGKRR